MDSISPLLRADGHAIFVWGAWLPCLLLLVVEAWQVRARLRRARAEAAERASEGKE